MSKKPENVPSPLLSIPEACTYVGVVPSTLYKIVMPRTGIVKIGRRTYLRRKSVDAYIAASVVPPTKSMRSPTR